MKILFAILIIGTTIEGFPRQKYNPFNSSWETVPHDWETKYNPFDQSGNYQSPGVEIEYNPFENIWEWESEHNNYGY